MTQTAATTGVVIDGRYRLCSVIADGAHARVWQARDLRLDRDVALKVLAPRADSDRHIVERFAREVQAASALSHPHVVTIYDSGRTAKSEYLVMELARWGTLADQIAQGPMTPSQIVHIARQLCMGLSAAHDAGIIHRDLKPTNILRTNEQTVKISDFGAAYLTGNDTELTATGMVVGTAPYMSPEQVRGDQVGPYSDLFSLGCVIYAMATGEPPFASGTPVGIAWRQLHQEVVPLNRRCPAIPPAMDGVVSVLLNKNPDMRPANAAIVADWLDQIPSDAPPNGATAISIASGGDAPTRANNSLDDRTQPHQG